MRTQPIRWGPAVLALVIFLSGCTVATNAKVIVVTATPLPTSKPKAHPRPPTVSPTPNASGRITLDSVTQDPAGNYDAVTLHYTVTNDTGTAARVFLGATVYPEDNSGNSFSDPANDTVVTAQTGTSTYSRSFSYPAAINGFSLDLLASVDSPDLSKVYDERRYPALIAASGEGATSTPAPSPPSASGPSGASSSGGFTDAATGMNAQVGHPQTVPTDDPTMPAGYELVVFYVTIHNTDSQPHDFNPLDFTCVDSSDQSHSAAVLLPSPYSDASLSYGGLAGGDTRAGWVGCEIPSGDQLRILWDDAWHLSPPVDIQPG